MALLGVKTRLISKFPNLFIEQFRALFTHKREILRLSGEEFVRRFIQHIPDKYFRVIRYYGFLANRVRCQLLTKVYIAIKCSPRHGSKPITYATLLKPFVNVDPLQCILCKGRMVLQSIR